MMLPGTAVTYNGEEIGMTDGFVRWDQTVDPWGKQAGIINYTTKSRDFCRTPLQWNSLQNSGNYLHTSIFLQLYNNYEQFPRFVK